MFVTSIVIVVSIVIISISTFVITLVLVWLSSCGGFETAARRRLNEQQYK